jgi:type II secretory pathway component PulF
LEPAGKPVDKPMPSGPFRGADFLAYNQQLAQLIIWFFQVAGVVSYSVMGLIAMLLLSVIAVSILSWNATGAGIAEALVLPLPLIGPILRWNLVSRWCNALHLGVAGGLPLPAAIGLARDSVKSARLHDDSQSLIETVSAGRSRWDPITSCRCCVISSSIPNGN